MLGIAALVGSGASGATAEGMSATGGSHLIVHDVFGLATLELQNFAFNAKIKPDGSADGWYTYREVDDGAPISVDGPVTCLTVVGNQAWIGGVVDKSSDSSIVGRGSWWHVTDNGEGADAPADITTFLGVGTRAETQAFCDTHPAYKHPSRSTAATSRSVVPECRVCQDPMGLVGQGTR
jgi:hypothetical protein